MGIIAKWHDFTGYAEAASPSGQAENETGMDVRHNKLFAKLVGEFLSISISNGLLLKSDIFYHDHF
jgi:hypothetical protein